jgi:hypothetical protein
VYDIAVPRREKYDGHYYAIMTFSTKGNIDDGTLRIITERASERPSGAIRYECISYSKPENYRRNDPRAFAAANTEIKPVADDWDAVFVFPVADSEKALDCPFIIYANKDGKVIFSLSREIA